MRRFVLVLALVGLTVGVGAPASAAGVPQTYSGSGEMGRLADYPAGMYLVEWDASGRWPDGQADGCQLKVIAADRGTREEVLISIPVRSGAENSGTERVRIAHDEDILIVDGTGCTWSVTLTPL